MDGVKWQNPPYICCSQKLISSKNFSPRLIIKSLCLLSLNIQNYKIVGLGDKGNIDFQPRLKIFYLNLIFHWNIYIKWQVKINPINTSLICCQTIILSHRMYSEFLTAVGPVSISIDCLKFHFNKSYIVIDYFCALYIFANIFLVNQLRKKSYMYQTN